MHHIVVVVAGVAIGLAVLAFVSLFENNTPNRPHSQRPRRPSYSSSPPPRSSRSESPRPNLRQRQTSNSNHMPNSTSVASRASSNHQNEPVVSRSTHSSDPTRSSGPRHSPGPRSLGNCPASPSLSSDPLPRTRLGSPHPNLRQRQTSTSNHMPNSTLVASSNHQNEPVVSCPTHSSDPTHSSGPSHSPGPRSLDNCPASPPTRDPYTDQRHCQTSNANRKPSSTSGSVASSVASSIQQQEFIASGSQQPPIISRASQQSLSFATSSIQQQESVPSGSLQPPTISRASQQSPHDPCQFQARNCYNCKETNDLVTFMPCRAKCFCRHCAMKYLERNEFCLCESRILSME